MSIWDKKEPGTEVQQAPTKDGGLEGMILGMVAKNPALAKAFEGLQNLIQRHVDQQTEIIKKLDLVLAQQSQVLHGVLDNAPGLPTGEARGVIGDGVRCPQCGASGDCLPDCPLGGGPINGTGSNCG